MPVYNQTTWTGGNMRGPGTPGDVPRGTNVILNDPNAPFGTYGSSYMPGSLQNKPQVYDVTAPVSRVPQSVNAPMGTYGRSYSPGQTMFGNQYGNGAPMPQDNPMGQFSMEDLIAEAQRRGLIGSGQAQGQQNTTPESPAPTYNALGGLTRGQGIGAYAPDGGSLPADMPQVYSMTRRY